MIQRTLIGACLTVVLASLVLVGLVWHQSNQAVSAGAYATRRLAEAQAANQAKTVELLALSQATNAEILKQLQTMAKASQSPSSPEWVPVVFKLTQETPDGPPATEYKATLIKGSAGLFESGVQREPDPQGLVDFGVVQPGDWNFELSRSWDEVHTWNCRGSINVLPGTNIVKTIVCPKPRPDPVQVKLRVPWPADLAGKNLRLEMTFSRTPTSFQPPLKWKVVGSVGEDWRKKVRFGPGLNLTEIDDATKLDFWYIYEKEKKHDVQRVFAELDFHSVRPESDAVAMEPGTLVLRTVIVLRPSTPPNTTSKRERFEVLAHAEATGWSRAVTTYFGDPASESGIHRYSSIDSTLEEFKGRVDAAPSYWNPPEGHFSVGPGKVNDWTIPLPDELIRVVRERLAHPEPPLAEPPHPNGGLGTDLGVY